MSRSMWSIDCLALKLNEDYFNALKKDIESLNADSILDENQKKEFLTIKEEFEDNEYEDIDELCSDWTGDGDINYYDGGKYSENYAYARKLNLENGRIEDGDIFDGYVYEISHGSSSIYEPEFKDKNELIETIKKYLYIPSNFDLENNVIFLTGVNSG